MVRSYLRQRRGVLLTFLLFGGLFAVTFALYSLPVQAVAYPFLLCVVAGSILLAADYRQALRRHRQMERVLRLPDEIAASLPPADTVEREDYRQLVALLEESRRQIQSQAQRRYGDMVDYYTLWAHQIKTPIASMRLTLQNEDSDLARSLSGDLMRVEQYVEMVLVIPAAGQQHHGLCYPAAQPGRHCASGGAALRRGVYPPAAAAGIPATGPHRCD